MRTITLKIFSGLHLGAEIELTEGTWTIGRDDSCDIILSDKSIATRHVSLALDGNGQVTFRNLDSTIQNLQGDDLTDNLLDSATLYALSGILFAWGDSDNVNAEFWKSIEDKLIESRTKTVIVEKPAEEASKTDEAEEPKAQETPLTPDLLPKDDDKPIEEEPAEESSSHGLLLTSVALAIAALIGCGGFIGYKIFEDSKSTLPKLTVAEAVRGAGFTEVIVTQAENGIYLFSGSVKDDEQRGRLVKFSKMLEHQVAIDVTVDTDYTMPLQSSFNTMDYWPSVTLRKERKNMELLVSGYMLSSVIEEKAFSKAVENVPNITNPDPAHPITVKRKIRYRPTVEQWIGKSFYENGVSNAKVDYLPGRIRISAVQTPESRARLEKAVASILSAADVPLKIDLVNAESKGGFTTSVATTPIATNSMTPSFRVTAVSGGALKYVTLSNGEKYFVGAPMPGGFILESISIDKLVLSKNNRRINYPLRISKQ